MVAAVCWASVMERAAARWALGWMGMAMQDAAVAVVVPREWRRAADTAALCGLIREALTRAQERPGERGGAAKRKVTMALVGMEAGVDEMTDVASEVHQAVQLG